MTTTTTTTATRRRRRFVVVGGGIAGCTAAEELLALEDGCEVTVLTATPVVKQVGRVVQVTRKLEEMEVVERDANDFGRDHARLTVVQVRVRGIDAAAHVVECESGRAVPFDRCLVCTGAVPKVVSASHPHVVGIRDTESVQELTRRLQTARRVVVLGNGGIALEVVHAVTGCEVVWAVKDAYVGNTFFDHTASGFVLPELEKQRPVRIVARGEGTAEARKGMAVSVQGGGGGGGGETNSPEQAPVGGALGPDWTEGLSTAEVVPASAQPLTILFQAELEELIEPSSSSSSTLPATPSSSSSSTPQPNDHDKGWPLFVRLTNGQTWGCDFVVSATGVVPLVSFLGPEFTRGEDGGIVVNEHMQTTASPDVYAAGDCCSMTWPESEVWFQMRLWTQARTMARYAARCMADQVDELGSGFAFELFAHMTRFFGFRVALLGCYNAQLLRNAEQRRLVQEIKVVKTTQGHEEAGMEVQANVGQEGGEKGDSDAPMEKVEILTRLTPGLEYIKVVVVGGRVKGAMLVGEGTELAETFENLILNELDVSAYGVDLLDPDVDIDDYFD